LPDTKPLQGLPLFDKSGIALLYGEGGSYKTFVALRWAHDVARYGPVIYVAAEGVPAIRRRKIALDELYGRRDGLYFLGDLNLLDTEHSKEVEEFGKQKGCSKQEPWIIREGVAGSSGELKRGRPPRTSPKAG
jgi:hypothetical protein